MCFPSDLGNSAFGQFIVSDIPTPKKIVLTLESAWAPLLSLVTTYPQTVSSSSYSEYPLSFPNLLILWFLFFSLLSPEPYPSFIASLQRTFYNSTGCKPLVKRGNADASVAHGKCHPWKDHCALYFNSFLTWIRMDRRIYLIVHSPEYPGGPMRVGAVPFRYHGTQLLPW